VPADVSDPDPLVFADAPSPRPADVIRSSQGVAAAGDPGSENVSSPTEVGSPGSVYRPEWGVTNGSLLDTPDACQDLMDHAAPLGYFSELRHMHNEDFLGQLCIPPDVEWRTNASKDGMPASGTYSVEAVRVLDTHRTPIQKQPEALLWLETAPPEVPPPEEVLVTTVPGGDQAAPV
nr:hypothetical protein [Tanacetum cinerariifolium]